MRALRPALVAIAVSCLAPPALADAPAGNAVAVIQQAKGEVGGASSTISIGDAVFVGQTVVTGSAGQVQVVFNDQTRLVVGPRSTLVISDYLMRNDQTASKVVVDALAGTFRFITGNSPKNAYEIATPTGTLGVRGTAFDLEVLRDTGETHVLLYHGGVDMCDLNGACQLLSLTCAIGVIPQHQPALVLSRADKRKPSILRQFPYLTSQIRLRGDFRVPGIDRCQDTLVAEETGNPHGIVVSPGPPAPPSDGDNPPPPPNDPPPPPPGGSTSHHDNNGIGNGGDTPSEGDTETGNPGHGGNGGNGHGNAYGHSKR